MSRKPSFNNYGNDNRHYNGGNRKRQGYNQGQRPKGAYRQHQDGNKRAKYNNGDSRRNSMQTRPSKYELNKRKSFSKKENPVKTKVHRSNSLSSVSSSPTKRKEKIELIYFRESKYYIHAKEHSPNNLKLIHASRKVAELDLQILIAEINHAKIASEVFLSSERVK